MDQRSYKRNLKFDFFPAQRGRYGQRCDLGEGLSKLGQSLPERRTIERPLSCSTPKACRFLDLSGLGAVTCQQLRLAFCNLFKLAFERFCDAGVKRAARLAQKGAIRRVLY
jgi:hypothetical protein